MASGKFSKKQAVLGVGIVYLASLNSIFMVTRQYFRQLCFPYES